MQDFYDVGLFHADIDIKEMVLQKTEVVDVQWVNQDKLLNMFQKKQLHPLIKMCIRDRLWTEARF